MRINDIEFRQLGGDRDPEIICWEEYPDMGKELCHTLLWFRKDREGYHIEFIGNRPLKYHNSERLWWLMEYGQSVLTAQWKLHEKTAI